MKNRRQREVQQFTQSPRHMALVHSRHTAQDLGVPACLPGGICQVLSQPGQGSSAETPAGQEAEAGDHWVSQPSWCQRYLR